jgi:hypothetical protein
MARPAVKTASQSFPRQGNRELSILWNFTAQVGSFTDDLAPEMEASEIESIQSVWVDNSANGNPLTIVFTPGNQQLIIPANTQGIYPVISWGRISYTISTTAAAVLVGLIFSNTAKNFYSWKTQ